MKIGINMEINAPKYSIFIGKLDRITEVTINVEKLTISSKPPNINIASSKTVAEWPSRALGTLPTVPLTSAQQGGWNFLALKVWFNFRLLDNADRLTDWQRNFEPGSNMYSWLGHTRCCILPPKSQPRPRQATTVWPNLRLGWIEPLLYNTENKCQSV